MTKKRRQNIGREVAPPIKNSAYANNRCGGSAKRQHKLKSQKYILTQIQI